RDLRALEDLLRIELVAAGLLLEDPPADLERPLLLLRVEPLADLALGARGDDERQPVAARLAVRAGQDLDHVAVLERGPDRHQLAVDARSRAAVSQIGVDVVGEIERRGAAREREHLAL